MQNAWFLSSTALLGRTGNPASILEGFADRNPSNTFGYQKEKTMQNVWFLSSTALLGRAGNPASILEGFADQNLFNAFGLPKKTHRFSLGNGTGLEPAAVRCCAAAAARLVMPSAGSQVRTAIVFAKKKNHAKCMVFLFGGRYRTRTCGSPLLRSRCRAIGYAFGRVTGSSSYCFCKKEKPRKMHGFFLVDGTGLEPVTPCTSSRCSSQLS